MERNSSISVVGAQTHNLKNLTVEVPKRKFVVFTGPSGSGKSSLVFDTIYVEAQRQLVETFSSFARRRLPKLSRPPVESIGNLSTAIVIDQKRMGRTLRSTVGTATEIATYLRMLYSRFGDPFIGPSFYFSFNNPEGMCTECSGLGKRIAVDTDLLLDGSKSLREGAITHPDYKIGGWMWRELMAIDLFDQDKKLADFSDEEMDRLLRSEPIPIEKRHGAGVYSKYFSGVARRLEKAQVNKADDEESEEKKDAYARYLKYSACPACGGTRLNERARSVRVNGMTIAESSDLELYDFAAFLSGVANPAAASLVTKMRRVASHLVDIGVGYLSLSRSVATLSGGESQRVKMARQLDCDLTDLLYVLDEPTTGLHPKDNEKLIGMLRALRDAGNSVLVVEHDPDVIRSADWIIDIGPKGGAGGGRLLYSGEVGRIPVSGSPTGEALARRAEPIRRQRRRWKDAFEIDGITANNLRELSVRIPKGVFTCVTGVAGSGKSTLVYEAFVKAYPQAVIVDQDGIGRTSRGTPASYVGAFDLIRKELGKELGADPGLFSFNSKGACPKCGGAGHISIEMSFLDDARMACDACGGRRYSEEALGLKYRGKDVAEILDMTAEEAVGFFRTAETNRRLAVLRDVGLDYLRIGQTLSSLSGGECQRLKLASELHKRGNVYVMDEPTSGLHATDIERLVALIDRMVGNGNTVVVIEHNLDVIANADWIIDMGPGGGKAGGRIITAGTPEEVACHPESHTGRFLRNLLASA